MTWRLTLDAPPLDTPHVLYDLTRLIRGRRRPAGSGVDRIDLALAQALTARLGPRCAFVAVGVGGAALVRREVALRLLAALERAWRDGGAASGPSLETALARALALGRADVALGAGRRLIADGVTYVNASHSGLPVRRGALARLDRTGPMRRLFYLHDLIPLEYPEYQTPTTAWRFRNFLDEAFARPATVLTNTRDTAERVRARAAAEDWPLERVVVASPRLILESQPATATSPRAAVRAILDSGRPWFAMLGTIEPRKNHLTMLHLWRVMAAEAEPPPLLVIIGRRGWENEMVIDMLDRCAAIAPHVAEFGDLDDREAMALLAGSRALLAPSFAEGLGVPVMEAAALGTPVVAADLPALREVAAPGTTFLDPLDAPAWRREIRDRSKA